MKILKVFEKNEKRGNIRIKFCSKNVLHIGNVVSIIYDEKVRYFKIDEIETDDNDNDNLIVYAFNYGYYDLLRNIDIRELLESSITLIEDAQTLKDLSKQSTYC